MSERGLRLRLGIFVVISIALLIGLVVLFVNWPQAMVLADPKGQTYTIRFAEAPGVEAGTPIRLSGIKVGKVEKVTLDDRTGSVTVTVRIDPGTTIRVHHVPTINRAIPSGDTSIDLRPNPREKKRDGVDPKKIITGRGPTSVQQLVDDGSEAVDRISNDLTRLRRSLEDLQPTVKTTTKEIGDLAKEIRLAVPDAKATLEEINGLAKDVRKAIPQVESTVKEIGELSKEARTSLPAITATAKEIGELSKEIRQTVPSIQETVKETGELIKDVRKSVPAVESTVKEVGELAKAVRESVPDLMETNKLAQKLIKDVNETVPVAKEVLSEIKLGVRNWSSVGERLDVFISTNEEMFMEIVENVTDVTASMKEIFGEDNQKAVGEILQNLTPASKLFPEIARNTNSFIREARMTLRRTEKSLDELDGTMKNARALLDPESEASKALIKNLLTSSQKLDAILTDAQTLMKVAASKDGTIRRFLTDPAIYNHLDDAAMGLTRLMPRIDRVIKDFGVFADKVARHPETIGLGGLVRPDPGLKDAPTPTRVWKPRR